MLQKQALPCPLSTLCIFSSQKSENTHFDTKTWRLDLSYFNHFVLTNPSSQLQPTFPQNVFVKDKRTTTENCRGS